ncbi:Dolichyl-phosphate-mannose-protein mannosyltransferase [Planktothrix tepida]|uniref:glycosyltransferase family 39 protein n=2 Tax=Planktothrix tepida TaxID=1678309 RepID=UPI0020B37F34|nr:glycosyltransferase family 39 protein [Planktothrix tepida]CAD5966311.1 Dolichyl-phosphate-mannose-protein mannosyltransferase [Planktothrix tepida]
MNQWPALEKQHPPTWLKSIVICLLALGIFFRFAHLGHKVYWHDESFTSLAISGHTLAEIKQEIFNHQGIIPITTLDKFQQINPDRGIGDTVRYLITSDPQHPPLYYVMARLWAQLFGDSPAQVRSLSAVISLLIFPCVYWLCLELFDAPSVGWVALGLIAVSPLEIFFAQEARQYGLWMVTILLSSAALLRAIRRESLWSWGLYALTLALGLYTHLFTILVAIAQGIYVVISQQFRWHKTLRNYLIATAMGLLMFLPWLIIFITHLHTALQINLLWSGNLLGNTIDNIFERIVGFLIIFLMRTSRVFIDINLASDSVVESYLSFSIIWIVLSLALIIYLLYFLLYKTKNKPRTFILTLWLFPSLSLLLCDTIYGGIQSINFRYTLPSYLTQQIAVAFILTNHLFWDNTWKQKVCKFIMVGLIIAGVFSDISLFKAETWWIQMRGTYFTEISQIVNKTESPLLISDNHPISVGMTLTLSHRLDPKVHLLTTPFDQVVTIPQDYNNLFFIDPSSSLLHQLQQDTTYSLKLIDPSVGFWHICHYVSLEG